MRAWQTATGALQSTIASNISEEAPAPSAVLRAASAQHHRCGSKALSALSFCCQLPEFLKGARAVCIHLGGEDFIDPLLIRIMFITRATAASCYGPWLDPEAFGNWHISEATVLNWKTADLAAASTSVGFNQLTKVDQRGRVSVEGLRSIKADERGSSGDGRRRRRTVDDCRSPPPVLAAICRRTILRQICQPGRVYRLAAQRCWFHPEFYAEPHQIAL